MEARTARPWPADGVGKPLFPKHLTWCDVMNSDKSAVNLQMCFAITSTFGSSLFFQTVEVWTRSRILRNCKTIAVAAARTSKEEIIKTVEVEKDFTTDCQTSKLSSRLDLIKNAWIYHLWKLIYLEYKFYFMFHKSCLMMSITREGWKRGRPQQTNPNCKSAARPDWGSRGGGVQPEVQQQIRAIVPQISGYFTRCHAGSSALGRHYSFFIHWRACACMQWKCMTENGGLF